VTSIKIKTSIAMDKELLNWIDVMVKKKGLLIELMR